jgi:sec-independent protein translocase protein TatC
MADPTEAASPEPEEEGGGPVKTFLEHLEDLRWVLIKGGAAILVGMFVCLLAVNKVVGILKWPLERARLLLVHKGQTVEGQTVGLYVGTNRLSTFTWPSNQFGSLNLGSNRAVALEVVPVEVGSNQVLGLRLATNSLLTPPPARGPDLIFLDPGAPFISSLYLAFYGGLFLSAPLVFYFVAQFIVPAMKLKEKKYFGRSMGIGLGLFVCGVCFCYFGIMPLALRAAVAYSNWMGVQAPQWRAEAYFSFVTKFMLGMGLGFELPVVLLALVKIGILDYKKLSGFRRYMIVLNLILGAVLTTPEPLTQIIMAVPLQALYEITVWIAWYWERKARKRAEAETAAAAASSETPPA